MAWKPTQLKTTSSKLSDTDDDQTTPSAGDDTNEEAETIGNASLQVETTNGTYSYGYTNVPLNFDQWGIIDWFTDTSDTRTETFIYRFKTGIQVFTRSQVVTIQVTEDNKSHG